MVFENDIEQQWRDKMTVIFFAEIMNRLGVVNAGKIFNNVVREVEEEKDEIIKLKMQNFISNVRKGYLKN
ncbi:TPA: hypothetical protein ME969_005338 [Klebsiella pneumoniae]|uniref:hypothetical protein n=1 Tax=Klebsiella pneumoniae TaxID=573 RepID=UPI000E2B3078|nr:hypothetical protein [Klebsiella pneumoniae]HBK9471326.1 hypothetical protein [Escherichia coli]HBM3200144.1 hypothetical protein [Klebsiella michiganensis]HBV1534205.1 hypothetical protein [Klebsiella aerogenes]HBZ8757406.1 hypothetical protein [Citrobacter freundii]HDR2791044.1 hypothetical protein [Enterobacter asburiae]